MIVNKEKGFVLFGIHRCLNIEKTTQQGQK